MAQEAILIKEKGVVTLNTVSYTHLDVYKRQVLFIAIIVVIIVLILIFATSNNNNKQRKQV